MESSHVPVRKDPDEHVVKRGVNYLLLISGYYMPIFFAILAVGLLIRGEERTLLRACVTAAVLLPFFVLARYSHSILKWWEGKGVRGILVYSDAPAWKDYIESHWLPAAGEHLKVLKLSPAYRWKPSLAGLILEEHLLNGRIPRPSLPVVLVFRGSKPISLINFNGPFLDHEAGDSESLKNGERRLAAVLGVSLPG